MSLEQAEQTTDSHLKPFLKWAGGKRQLLPVLMQYLPPGFHTYYEPFIGAGALLMGLKPRQAVLNDLNHELITCYKVIQKQPEELIRQLKKHQNSSEYFYALRGMDRDPEVFTQMNDIQRASRMIYLNKTCYNGLYRVNRKGEFNAPYGKYNNPCIVDEAGIRAVHQFLNARPVKILNTDFELAVQGARAGDMVYFDPPYDPLSESASFTAYQECGFGRTEQRRLARVVNDLTRRGCRVMLSNSATDFIRSLYKDYKIYRVSATRRINSVGARRGEIDEVLVLNYIPETGQMIEL